MRKTIGFLLVALAAGIWAGWLWPPADAPIIRGDPPTRSSPALPSATYARPELVDVNGLEGRTAITSDRERLPSDSEEARGVWVLVQDERRQPLAQAKVSIHGPRSRVAGHTDPDGRLRTLVLPQDREVVASHPRWSTASLVLPADLPRDLLLVLSQAQSLAGRVVWRDGTPAPPRTKVVAWRDGYPPTELQIESLLGGADSPGLAITECREDGTFELQGLQADRYTVAAGGRGGITIRGFSGLSSGQGERHEVRIDPVYSAVVLLRTETGTELETPPYLFARGASWYVEGIDGEALEPLFGEPIGFVLTRHPGDRDWETRSLGSQLLLAKTATRTSQLTPIVYEVEIPGYAPAWTTVTAHPVGSPAPRYVVRLQDAGVRRGTVEVVGDGTLCRLRPDSATADVFGLLRLSGPQNEQITACVFKPFTGRALLEGIPFGTYAATFVLNDAGLQIPEVPATLEVRTQSALFFLDLAGLVMIEVQVFDEAGAVYTGSATFRIASRDLGTRFLDFRSGPYVLGPLPIGDYWIAVDRAPGYPRELQTSVPIRLDPGTNAVYALQLRR